MPITLGVPAASARSAWHYGALPVPREHWSDRPTSNFGSTVHAPHTPQPQPSSGRTRRCYRGASVHLALWST
ncbi:hypothetical protein KCU71_g23560, partial [Aureobasidium melanogenum]